MSPRLEWRRDSLDWPHAEYSRFVTAGHLRWHVQCFEPIQPPADGTSAANVLLVHGTGASTHSWRANAPVLSERARVLAIDLPGHGFTERPPPAGLSLPGMARRLGELLDTLDFRPDLAIGHSAGAAILVRMALDARIAPKEIVSLNGALYPFRGRAERAFPSIARALFLNPFVPRLFALGAGSDKRVARLIRGTGSTLDARGLALYGRLFASAEHAGAALGMMARWDLDALDADIKGLAVALSLVVGDQDRAVAPEQAGPLAERLSRAEVIRLEGLGHLAHEEDPIRVNDLLLARLAACRKAVRS